MNGECIKKDCETNQGKCINTHCRYPNFFYFYEARDACEASGGTLVSPVNYDMDTFIKRQVILLLLISII